MEDETVQTVDMIPQVYRRVRLEGTFTGQMWMGGQGFLPVTDDLLSRARRIVGKATLSDVVDSFITECGGDFQDTKLTNDSYIVVEHTYSTKPDRLRIIRRYLNVIDLPSLADLVARDISRDPGFADEI